MKRNIIFVIELFFTTLALMAAQKIVFLLRYASLSAEAAPTDYLRTVWHGLSLDATVAGYVVALPLLMAIAAIWLPSRRWHTATHVFLLACAAAVAVIFAVNLGLYEYWAFPLDASVFQYLASPKEAAASVTPGEWAGYTFAAAAYFAVMAACYRGLLRGYHPEAKAEKRITGSIIMLFLGCCVFLAIRGGENVVTANISKVYFGNNMFLNHAAVNPVFSLVSSATYADGSTNEYDFFAENECAEAFESLRGDRLSACGTDTLLRVRRPDVILILAESFGRSTVDALVDGEPVAPNFRKLKGEGIYFDNLIANSFRTDRGMVAVLSGFPSQTKSSIMKNPSKSRHLPSVARSLRREGYATSFVYGGDPDFTNTSSYLYGTGFDRIVGQHDLRIDAPTSKWGYADDVMADAFIRHTEECRCCGKPFFAVWLTLSSHEPFDVPMERFDDRMLNSMAFADECIGRVVDALRRSPKWDDTLVVIVADHAYPYPYGIAGNAVGRHRIPMLWTGGAVKRPAVVDTYASQTDIAATLLAQMGIAHDDYPFSRDIFDPRLPKFGYYVFNDGFGVVDTDGATIFDCTAGRVISPDSTERHLRTGRTLLQTTYKMIESMQ